MKLYYSPGACSLAPHIVAHEIGRALALEQVTLKTHTTETGVDFRTVNPKGYVPTLLLDNGETLTEVAAILQYLADQAPERQLVPAAGTMQHYRLLEWLNFISSEVHKTMATFFNPKAPEEWKAFLKKLLARRLGHVETQLAGKTWLTGEAFTVADAYLFTILGWARLIDMDLSPWPGVQAWIGRVAARPAVQAALKAEGLV